MEQALVRLKVQDLSHAEKIVGALHEADTQNLTILSADFFGTATMYFRIQGKTATLALAAFVRCIEPFYPGMPNFQMEKIARTFSV